MIHHQSNNPEGRKISPAPNWTAIFSVRHDLAPPGYDEVFLDMIENPRIKPKEVEKQKVQEKKKKRKLGRGQTA
jgi:hypothetical protein